MLTEVNHPQHAALQQLLAKAENLYALYDAARNSALLADLQRQGISHHCLFSGSKEFTLKTVAPYLLACRDFDGRQELFINTIWQRGVSMLVESAVSLEQLRIQLKKNTFVKNAQRVDCYFRYYDARAYSRFVRMANNEQLCQLFGTAIRTIYWIDTRHAALASLTCKRLGPIARLLDPDTAKFDFHIFA